MSNPFEQTWNLFIDTVTDKFGAGDDEMTSNTKRVYYAGGMALYGLLQKASREGTQASQALIDNVHADFERFLSICKFEEQAEEPWPFPKGDMQ